MLHLETTLCARTSLGKWQMLLYLISDAREKNSDQQFMQFLKHTMYFAFVYYGSWTECVLIKISIKTNSIINRKKAIVLSHFSSSYTKQIQTQQIYM